MNELLEKYRPLLPQLFLELYDQFKEEYVAEYEFIKDTQGLVQDMTQSTAFDQDFYFFFRNPVGSLYGFWILEETDFSKNPIVQFSSDGIFGVLAPNFEAFLSQLHLLGADAWQLSEYISLETFCRMMKKDFAVLSKEEIEKKYPRWMLTEEQIAEHIQTVKDDFGGAAIINWLIQHNIPPIAPKDLFSVVLHTLQSTPNLEEYINQKKSPL